MWVHAAAMGVPNLASLGRNEGEEGLGGCALFLGNQALEHAAQLQHTCTTRQDEQLSRLPPRLLGIQLQRTLAKTLKEDGEETEK